MRTTVATAVVLATVTTAAIPALGQESSSALSAQLVSNDGTEIGQVTLSEGPNGLVLHASLRGLPAGEHGFHLHETGRCELPSFESAGGHYNPNGAQHGFMNEAGPHAGDMPNITVLEDGIAEVKFFLPDLTIEELADTDGTAVMIHSGPDDYQTDPGGDAGDRIACGEFVVGN